MSDEATVRLHRLHWRLGVLIAMEAPLTAIRGCADQHAAALEEWCRTR